MVDVDFRAGCSLEGGMQLPYPDIIVSETCKVYRPAALSTIWKLVPQEPVTQDETGLRRNCASRRDRMCSATTVFIAPRRRHA
jgi:hypothetical protein